VIGSRLNHLEQLKGIEVTLISETFQHTGSFKFRGAFTLAQHMQKEHFITASSGNFGQALALACKLLSKRCTVVMPQTSAQVKIDGVRSYGGEVILIDTTQVTRGKTVHDLGEQNPGAYIAHSYDDPWVIAGNATLGRELATLVPRPDCIVVPIGGGGLSSGIITGLREAGADIDVIGAEPLLANDAARSLRAGEIIANDQEPDTIADGARTLSLGMLNWEILRKGLQQIVEVPEDVIRKAVRMAFSYANLKVEPTGALSIGAILTNPELFAGKHVYCVVSGGNVDAATYRSILTD
jgi:threo-3-hydroxy-L-aspartate ammonia-lyase